MTNTKFAIARYQKRTRWAWVGLALQPIALLILGSFTELDAVSLRAILAVLLFLLSMILMNVGIWNYAKAKGYSNAVAALSLFNVYGLLILVWLPDRNRRS